ncbi:MAG: Ig-like domain-containing protein, partial [Armatimonadota bacterium]|nr:Ig-like domain-containing protein [Armatimonadota bacterium]
GQTLTASVTATNAQGKSSTVEVRFPVTLGIRISRPLEGARAQKEMVIRAEAAGNPAYVRLLVNGYEIAKLTKPPYQHVWNPFGYQEGTHEIVAEAYDAEERLVDFDVVHVRVVGSRR